MGTGPRISHGRESARSTDLERVEESGCVGRSPATNSMQENQGLPVTPAGSPWCILAQLSVFCPCIFGDLATCDHGLLRRPEARPIASKCHLEEYSVEINGSRPPVLDVMITPSLGAASLGVMLTLKTVKRIPFWFEECTTKRIEGGTENRFGCSRSLHWLSEIGIEEQFHIVQHRLGLALLRI